MAELPKELEDMVGELMEEQEDLFEEMEDTAANWADSIDKGAGWDTARLVWISTLRFPCRIATGAIRTSLPIAMVPVRSLMTTFAVRSASRLSASTSAMNSMRRFE